MRYCPKYSLTENDFVLVSSIHYELVGQFCLSDEMRFIIIYSLCLCFYFLTYKELENMTPTESEEYQSSTRWIRANITQLECQETMLKSPDSETRNNYKRGSGGVHNSERPKNRWAAIPKVK